MKNTLSVLCLLLLAFIAQAQSGKITGQVLDAEKGDILIGVTVTVKGTNKGTQTGPDGRFSLEAPNTGNVVLRFSYVGYQPQEVTAGSTPMLVKLSPGGTSLNDVVVVGYGTQKKREVTGAVATFNAEKLDERPLTRVDQALVGQMAGVQVKQTTGAPGKPFSINVRGAGSIGASNEPLYVIDGFPLTTTGVNGAGNFASGSPLDNINPNDIESIQVLKDAAAAAIYGSRAANGVVIINTRKGKQGKVQFNVNAYTGISQASKKLDVLSPQAWIDRATLFINAQWEESASGRSASQNNEERRRILGLAPGQVNPTYMTDDRWYRPGHPGLAFIDWQDAAFRTAPFQNYQLSASGGNELARYYISANYQNQQGFITGMDYKSYSARANVEANLSQRLKFGLNLAPTYSIRNDPGVEGKDNILHQLSTYTPVVEDTMGLYVNAYNNDRYIWGESPNSPIAKLQDRIGQTKMYRSLATAYLDLEVIKGLNLRTSLNFDNVDNSFKRYYPYTSSSSLSSRQSQPLEGVSGQYTSYRRQTFINENTISYNTSINGEHNISAMLGQSYNTFKIDEVTLSSTGNFTSTTTTTLPVNSTGNTTESRSVLISYFGRAQYDYKGRYLLSASLRRDGSSRFGSDSRWGWFPSASIGWRVSDEAFLKGVEQINDLKLRASYGKSGNNNITDYGWLSTLSDYNYSFGGGSPLPASGRGNASIPNPDLHWEVSTTYNYGLDLTVFNNRITAAFDIYSKRNSDLLLNVPAAAASGFTTYLANVGKVLNKGWELELSTRNFTGPGFSWNTSINLSHNTNKVESLGTDQATIDITQNFGNDPYAVMQVGLPMYSINVVQQNGVLTADDIAKNAPMYGGQKVGDPRYVDANHDGKITAADRVVAGHPNPDYTWGITNSFRYKGFDLTVLVQGQNGGSIYSLFGRAVNRTGMGYIQNVLDVDVSERGNYRTSFGSIANTDWLYSSDYVSVRNITLGYDLLRLIPKGYITAARVYVTAENWFRWDKYAGGWNPESANANLSSDSNYPMPGDYGGLPLAKSLILGVNFSF